jgi:hypothetical protein
MARHVLDLPLDRETLRSGEGSGRKRTGVAQLCGRLPAWEEAIGLS